MEEDGTKTNKMTEAADNSPAEPKKKSRRRLRFLLVLLCVCAVCGLVGAFVLPKVDFLGSLVRTKVQAAAEKTLKADVSISPLAGNPITGYTASDIKIERKGRSLFYAKNIGVDISMPSLLRGKPRVSLIAVSGADTSLDDIMDLIPKTKHPSKTPTEIPIDTVMISDSILRTKWGDVKFSPSYVYIDNSFYYDLDIAGKIKNKPFTAKGALEKVKDNWTANGFTASLAKGSAQLSGSLYPSADISVTLTQLNLTDVSELLPQFEKYGVVGMLSGAATFAGNAKVFSTKGKGLLQNAVIRGFPLEELQTEWNCAPGLLDVNVSKGQIFNSNLTGSIRLEKKSDDTYLKVAADIKNLHFADWNKRLEEQTHGKLLLLQGGVSSLKADVSGPLNALKGSVELGPSDIGYKEVDLKGLKGKAVFTGGPSGLLDLTAAAEGRKVSLSGRLSFGDKVPNDLSFSTDGYPIQNILRSLPKQPKMQASGTVSMKAKIQGLYGRMRVTADMSSSAVSADRIGVVNDLKAAGAINMGDKRYDLKSARAVWNGARLSASGTGSYAADSDKALALAGTADSVDLTRFYKLVPAFETLNMEGRASGKWKVTGPAADPTLTADVRADTGRFRDIQIARLVTKLSYKGGRIDMSPMDVTACGGTGRLTCSVTLPKQGSKTSWKVSGNILHVDMTLLNGLLKTDEKISGPISGTMSAGSLPAGGIGWSAKITAAKMAWRDFQFTDMSGTLAGGPDIIKIIKADGSFLKGKTHAEGTIDMPRDGQRFADAPLDLDITTSKLSVYELLRRHLPNVRSIQGLIGGTLKVRGAVGDPQFSGQARLAPIRCRGFMLPMMDTEFHGTLKELVVSHANAVIRDGTIKAYGKFYEQDKEWYGDFSLKGDKIELRQFGAYLPEGFRKRFGGVADFSISGKGKLSEISGKGTFTSPQMRFMGIQFKDISAPFYISGNYAMIEDLKAKINGGTLAGGVGFDLKRSGWGGNLTVMSTDIGELVKQAVPDMKGKITGNGDLKVRGGGEMGRASTIRGGGAVSLRKGEISGFEAVETAKKYTKGKPLLYDLVNATFTYDGGDVSLLPGSQATAPIGDSVYRYVMLDGLLSRKGEISLFAMGKVNIRALNSLIGAFQGLVSAGVDIASGNFDKTEIVQNVLGGVISGMSKNEFNFVTMNINGTVEKPTFSNIKIGKATTQSSAKDSIPTSQSDPDDKDTSNNGNFTLKFKFEVPLGPGYSGTKGDAKGQVVEQTLENVIKNVDFGLK